MSKSLSDEPVGLGPSKNIDRHYQLSDHFQAWEFYCHDGTPITQHHVGRMRELLEFLERLRAVMNVSLACGETGLTVISGYRHPDYNKNCGGATNSGHLFENGAACDIRPMEPYFKKWKYNDFWSMCVYIDSTFTRRQYRLGNYEKSKASGAWVHIGSDFGVGGTRWFK